jgi:hypothetical protein
MKQRLLFLTMGLALVSAVNLVPRTVPAPPEVQREAMSIAAKEVGVSYPEIIAASVTEMPAAEYRTKTITLGFSGATDGTFGESPPNFTHEVIYGWLDKPARTMTASELMERRFALYGARGDRPHGVRNPRRIEHRSQPPPKL